MAAHDAQPLLLPPPAPPLRQPPPTDCPPLFTALPRLQLPGVAGGFASAFALWSVLTKDADQKLPKASTGGAWRGAGVGAPGGAVVVLVACRPASHVLPPPASLAACRP